MCASMTRPAVGRVTTMVMVSGGLFVLSGCYAQEEPQPVPTAPAIAALVDTPVVSLPPESARDYPEEPAYAVGSYNGVDYYVSYTDGPEPERLGRLICLITDTGGDDGTARICGADSDDITLTLLNVPGDHTLVGDSVDTDDLTESGWKKVGLNVWTRAAP
ncbi:hypothetical protein [uncultured Citricoccus sp.]|mgnify:CR=1 FL=1|uniref:hypothetical protein n=1 Tax=uncultured Citricoccus sp. TaxID=614031 RepID=UPI00261A53D7|nr:hypothetical protein [uncultured Citricoccus sp.]HRO31610.1 hypothetical protein [Citricoccus sp.]